MDRFCQSFLCAFRYEGRKGFVALLPATQEAAVPSFVAKDPEIAAHEIDQCLFHVADRLGAKVRCSIAANEEGSLKQTPQVIVHFEAGSREDMRLSRLLVHEAMPVPIRVTLAEHGGKEQVNRPPGTRTCHGHVHTRSAWNEATPADIAAIRGQRSGT